ncbi:MAG: pyridoxal-phosphate dependent enzyme [Chryseolinea sp.]
MLDYHSTPIQELFDPLFVENDVRLFVKREDLNHPTVSGNKWWKLKYNLDEALRLSQDTLLTYGGAFSNHIFATAAAAHAAGLKSIGVIRGEETLPLNNILLFAQSQGMILYYASREDFKRKNGNHEIRNLKDKFGEFYLIPEGGSNELAIKGVEEFARILGTDFDYLCCAVGTGATLAGLIRGLKGEKIILGFTVLKGDGWEDEVQCFNPIYSNWRLIKDYHEGGYAKTNPSLSSFMTSFTVQHSIPLEHVYTGKMFKGIYDLISKGDFKRGSKIMAIHSGGIH